MNIDPRRMTPRTWCDFMVLELGYLGLGQIPFLTDETQWQRWGQQLNLLPGIAAKNPPDPMQFDKFEEWAMRFNSAVPL